MRKQEFILTRKPKIEKLVSKGGRMNKSEKKLIKRANILGVDMDGTICKEICWTPEQCFNATPNWELIEKIHKLGITKSIIVYTARRDELLLATRQWLRKHNIRVNGIDNNKQPFVFIDDKAIGLESFMEEDTIKIDF